MPTLTWTVFAAAPEYHFEGRMKNRYTSLRLTAAGLIAWLPGALLAADAEADSSTHWLLTLSIAGAIAIAGMALQRQRRTARRERKLFDTAPLATIVWSSPGQLIEDWNPAAEQLFGWQRHEVLGRNLFDVVTTTTHRQALLTQLEQVVGDSGMEHTEATNITKDGASLLCEWHSAILGKEKGHFQIISTADDLSDRRLIEQALRDNQAKLRNLFENSMVGIIATTADLMITDSNPALCEMLGYRRDELLGRSLNDLIHAEDRPLQTELATLLYSGKRDNFRITQRYIHCDGSILYAQIDVHCARRDDGTIDHLVGIIDNISERKHTEEKLQNSEQRQRRIVDELPLAMMQTSNGYIEYVNSKLTALLGYTREDIPSLEAWSLQVYPDPDYRSFAGKAMAKLAEVAQRKGSTNIPIELRVRAKNGSDLEIEYLYADFGEFGIWTLNDVTERNRSEQALLQANLHLQDQLSEIRQLQEKLRDQAIRDGLTGLFNRRYLDETLERELSRAQREGYPIVLAMIDIDFFKKLNDTYGHQAGDEILKELGNLLKKGARIADVPCRYGGEEFMLVLPNMSLDVAIPRAEMWREAFKALRVNFGQFQLQTTISIGLAAFPGDGKTRDALVEAADQALYAAKHGGRDQVAVHQLPLN